MSSSSPSRFVFWQNMLAIHQSAHIRALAERPGAEVVLVVDQEIYPERKALGWPIPDFGKAKIMVAPSSGEIEKLVKESAAESVHIFTGFRYYKAATQGFLASLAVDTMRGVFVEPKDGRGAKGILRWIMSAEEYVRFGRNVNFLLPTGELGVRWFRRAGFPAEKIYPYGYWVEEPTQPDTPLYSSDAGEVRIVYAGQFVVRKGVDLLVGALAGLQRLRWKLTLIGSGPLEEELREAAEREKIADRIAFLPVMPNNEVIRMIGRHDLFVLPSRFDGWGAVVNEALMAGVPVVCSDACGAADLVREPWRGEVFAAGSVDSLRAALARRIDAGQISSGARERIRDWSCRIGGKSAAQYLLAVVEAAGGRAPKPCPPWREAEVAANAQ